MKSFKLKDFQVVVIGPQGSGKGTQSSLLASKFGFIHIPLGDILKSSIFQQKKEIISKIKRGELLADEEVFSILGPYLEKLKDRGLSNFVFDGIPRTRDQAIRLKELLRKLGFSNKFLYIFLEVDDATTIERISKRRVCDRCKKIFYLKDPNYSKGRCSCGGKLVVREDDKEEVVRKRLQLFHEKTEEVIDELSGGDKLIKVDGKPSIDEVLALIVKELGTLR